MARSLVDDVLVELFLDFARGRNVGKERLGHAPAPPFLVQNRLAKLDAFAADVNIARTFHERADVAVALAAKRAVGVFLCASGPSWGRTAPAAASLTSAAAAAPAAGDVLT